MIPITNATSISSTGDHWSLLVWYPHHEGEECDRFLHFDSIPSHNEGSARQTMEKVATVFGLQNIRLFEGESPKQNNSCDCGMYVLAAEEFIARHGGSPDGLCDRVTPDYIYQYRRDIKKAIVDYGHNHPPTIPYEPV